MLSEKLLKILMFLMLISTAGKAQDIHFSDFYASPLNLNPALTGMFKGTVRISAIYRDQYRSVAVPYQTFSLGIDAGKDNMFKLKNTVGYGVLLTADQAGDAEYQNVFLSIPLSLQVHSNQGKNTFSAGLSVGGQVSSINYEKLRFMDQYNGSFFDPDLPSGENFSRSSLFMPSIAAGVAMNVSYNRFNRIIGGLSIYNLLPPKNSWLNDNVRLQNRYGIFVMSPTLTGNHSYVTPSMKYTYQGKQQEIQAGGQMYFLTGNSAFYSYYFGLWLRALDWDALILNAGINYLDFNLGFSYDINLSKLYPASNGRGAWEISLTYIKSEYKKRRKKASVKCPGYF